jgi:hypothetical protein
MNQPATQGTEGQPEGAPAPAPAPAATGAPSPAPEASAPAAPPAAAPAPAPAAAPLSIGQRLAAAAASLNGKGTAADVESLRAQLTGERDSLQGKLQAATDKSTGLQTDLAAANTRLAEAEKAVTDFEASVVRRSVDLVASAGVPLSQLPAAEASGTNSGVPATRAELEDKMKNLSTADAVKLLREFNAVHGNN